MFNVVRIRRAHNISSSLFINDKASAFTSTLSNRHCFSHLTALLPIFRSRKEASREDNGPLGAFLRQLKSGWLAEPTFSLITRRYSMLGPAKRHRRDNRKFAVRYPLYPIAFGFYCFFSKRESGYRAPGKSTAAWIMRLSDITAGVRAVATAHCYNRATIVTTVASTGKISLRIVWSTNRRTKEE